MEAKKGQDHLDYLNDKIFVQHRLLANNERTREIERKVQEIDVADKQKPVDWKHFKLLSVISIV